ELGPGLLRLAGDPDPAGRHPLPGDLRLPRSLVEVVDRHGAAVQGDRPGDPAVVHRGAACPRARLPRPVRDTQHGHHVHPRGRLVRVHRHVARVPHPPASPL
ncbi:MAG: hypothetical protein AVDCRST_MAG83-1734, partial [uncultured Arthrobacter sp.]